MTALRKGANDTWTIVQPSEAPADRNNVSDVVTNLANLEEQRVVDENAADLKAYGLAEPRIDVTFNVEGEKEPKRILFGEKTPTSSGTYAKLPSNNRFFLWRPLWKRRSTSRRSTSATRRRSRSIKRR